VGLIFIETPEFADKFDRLATQEEMLLLQNELIGNPTKGRLIQGTGGARKIRLRLRGRGKSGGARVVYYYVDFRGEIWLLQVYAKSAKADLTVAERSKIYRFIKGTIR
jgi:mRNA-degrading endonuclease RelE of RelBE toxin-antitoxin system